MSQIDRNISVVVTGSSTGSANRPNAPPAAPVVATASLCSRLLGLLGVSPSLATPPDLPSVRSAMCRHLRSASCVASLILSVAKPGSLPIIFSTGAPTTLVSLIVSDGLSSASFARRSVSRSSADSVGPATSVSGSI